MPGRIPLHAFIHTSFHVLLGMALWMAASLASAQEARLSVRPLRDAGGIERGLNVRLTTALAHFLNENGGATFRVDTMGTAKPDKSETVLRYTLEGDLSCASGEDEENARFLLVTRLYREGAIRTLIGQWAGTSNSFRYLTTNLRNDPRVHTLGLVGEVGHRIVTVLALERSRRGPQWQTLLPRMNAGEPVTIELTSAEDGNDTLRQIRPDRPFRLRVRTANSVGVSLLLSDRFGALHLANLSKDSREMPCPGSETTRSQPITLPNGTNEVWALCRFSSPGVSRPGRPHGPPVLQTDDSPVHVLDGIGNAASDLDRGDALSALLSEIARRPETWRAQRLRIGERAGIAK